MITADQASSSGLDVSCRTHSAVTRDMKQPRGHIWLECAILSSRGKSRGSEIRIRQRVIFTDSKKSSAILKYLLMLKSPMTHSEGVKQVFLPALSVPRELKASKQLRSRHSFKEKQKSILPEMFCLFAGCFISMERLAVVDREGELK